MRKIALFLMMLLIPSLALAGAELSTGTLKAPPQEVLEHLARSFSGYELEDYCEIYDTPDGDYGFALLKAGDERLLVGYEERDGRMSYWLKNHGAVMQGNTKAWFNAPLKGEQRYDAEGNDVLTDGLSFSVTCEDEEGELYEKYIGYRWEDGRFKLTGYKDWTVLYGEVEADDGVLHFKNEMEGWDFGRAYGVVQRDLRYVSFDALPKTIEQAKAELTTAPAVDSYVLVPQKVRFTGGEKYPVYTGPGEQFARSGNGKGSVSTNDWIQVFGEYDGWIMVQYDISVEQYRIGWIRKEALPKGTAVNQIDLSSLEKPYNTEAVYECTLTDDPINSKKTLAKIPKGTPMTELIYRAIDGWSYVVVTIDGSTMCGFVPSDAPIHG